LTLENGAGVVPAVAGDGARIAVHFGEQDTQVSGVALGCAQVYTLHRGKAPHSRAVARVIRCDAHPQLFQVDWRDGELSPPANLTRCMAAAREWAERRAMTEHRKTSVARRLKSLANFWWSSSPIEQTVPTVVGRKRSPTGETLQ
jgi:hypothetical protein